MANIDFLARIVVVSLGREVKKTKKTDRRAMMIMMMMMMMMTGNIVEEHHKVIVITIQGLIGEKREVNMILKDVGTERDVEEEEDIVTMMMVMV